ncbi:isocitrate lyase/phosphoenolpyruvate mutase family protein [Streptomyces sp. SID10815]|uniref:isocitrate lyase/phosphoenolpyruvate mutase family protein n=1 Tax=Streptomyces sp. SID10815 TaxID=2706027 RepID=UPI0013CD2EC9|nr:isocitrate lyase/phosphoenolpyruvate mutase family protein [Streptomyces sp. SID10815]
MSGAATFRALHHGRAPGDPLVLPGPWDAASARVFAEAGFPALATPSAGIAASLGYADGRTPAPEMFAAVARIARAVDVPVSADVEDGYGLAPKELVDRLLEAGAVGCNLEDSHGGVLEDPRRQADFLAEVRAAAGDLLFVNARLDTFVHGGDDGGQAAGPAGGRAVGSAIGRAVGHAVGRAVEEAVERAALYVAAGADCVYPILAPVEALPALRAGIRGPVNVLARPGEGPSPAALGELGADRVTFGPGLQRRATAALREIAEGIGR